MELWKRKVLKDAAKSVIPFQRQLRLLKRRFVPYQDDRGNSVLALQQGLDQISMLRASGRPIDGTILEFGSGWLPIIPLIFHIAGAKKMVLTDVERLMDEHTQNLARKVLDQNIELVSQTLNLRADDVYKKIADFDPEYIVPWSVKSAATHSVDMIISRAVFEHIPADTVANIFLEFKRIVKLEGAMCHIIDNSDHCEHHDKSISRVNFLKYSPTDFWWKITCMNQQNYQNRLRHSDYIKLMETNGWTVELATGEPDPSASLALRHMSLARSYQTKDIRDMAILTSGFVARPSGAPQTSNAPTALASNFKLLKN